MYRTFFALALLCSIIVGCAQKQPAAEPVSSSLSHEDSDLKDLVYKRLREDPVTGRANLSVLTDDGIVTLIGTINSSEMRLRALSIIRSTPGVRGVIDKSFQY